MNRHPLYAACMALLLTLAACSGDSEQTLLATAKAFIDKKDSKSAVIQLKSTLQKYPESAEARLLLGQQMLASGDAAGAAVELRKARELQVEDDRVVPDLARALLLSGEAAKVLSQFGQVRLRGDEPAARLATTIAGAHLAQGNVDKANESVATALQAQPTNAGALTLQSRLKAAAGDVEGALSQLQAVLARDATDLDAGMFKGDVLRLAKNDLPGALAAYQQVLAAHPDAVVAHSAIMTVLLQQDRKDDAKAHLALMKKSAPNNPDTLFFEAQVAYNDKDYKTTRDLTDRILKVAPDSVRVLELAGAAEYQRKAYGPAQAFLTQALKGAPNRLLTRQMLAQAYLRGGQPERSIEVLQPILDQARPDARSLALAGEAYLQAGDAKRSEEAYARAAKAAPDDTRLRTSLAVSQLARGGGNNPQALQTLEGLAADDKGARADLAIISAKLRANDIAGALKALDALQKKQPDRPLAYHLRGRVQLSQNDRAAARASFEQALSKDAVYFPAVASLAALDAAEGKPENAKKRLEALVQADPSSYQARLALAELAARGGAPSAEVTRLLSEAAKANASEPRPHIALVTHLLNIGDNKAAITAAQNAAAALPDNAEVLQTLGRAQLMGGDAQQALVSFRKLVSMQPKRPAPLLALAEAQAYSKDWDEAARSLRRALELQPDLLPAKRALVVLGIQRGKPQDGLPAAREIQKSSPGDATGYMLEGEIQVASKNWDGAAAAFRTAIQKAGAPTEAATKLHQVLLAAGKRPDAERFATDWQKDKPKDVAFRYYLGDYAMAQNDLAGAEAYYRAVLDINPQHALAMNNLAWLLVRQGKPGALALATKANELAPGRAPLLDTLATAQAAEGQLKEAVETQKRAVALAPQDPSLKLNLARLYLKAGNKAFAASELDTLAALGDKYAGQAQVQELLKQAR
jgi:putative PEP-CTERM system TPR-repeat lipoprotein